MTDAVTKTIDRMLRPDQFDPRSSVLKIGRRQLVALGRQLLKPGQTLAEVRRWLNERIGGDITASSFYRWVTRFYMNHDQVTAAIDRPDLVAYSPAELAARLRITKATATRLIESGQVGSVTVAGNPRVPAPALESFLTARRKQGKVKARGEQKRRNGARRGRGGPRADRRF